jgi:hypothetical protein
MLQKAQPMISAVRNGLCKLLRVGGHASCANAAGPQSRAQSLLATALTNLGTETPNVEVVMIGLLNCVAASEHALFGSSGERNQYIARLWKPLLNDLKKEQAAKILNHLEGDLGSKIDIRITVELCRYASSKTRWLSVMSMKVGIIKELNAMGSGKSE